eukprot:COSAG05_NODE_452_length_9699_cov_33.848125_2_plen_80_part_00
MHGLTESTQLTVRIYSLSAEENPAASACGRGAVRGGRGDSSVQRLLQGGRCACPPSSVIANDDDGDDDDIIMCSFSCWK